jgi:HK97 gp10 family phage protein
MGGFKLDDAALPAIVRSPEVQSSVGDLADVIFRESQFTVPVDTGMLKASGFVDGDGTSFRVGYGEPGGPVDYAKYVEHGTSHMNAQPFLTPAALRYRGVIR